MRSMVGRDKRKMSGNIDQKTENSRCKNAITAAAVLMFILPAAMATEYTVGDATGWDFAPTSSYYSDWATGLKFLPGDKLVFKYLPSAHNVQEVTEADYLACDGINPIAEYETGNDIVTLGPKPTQHFFICGFLGHCDQGGMKLNATVLSPQSSSPTNSSSPSPSPMKPTPQLPSPMTSTVPQLPGGDIPTPSIHRPHGHSHGALPPSATPISTPGGHSRAAPSPVPVRLTLLLLLTFIASLYSWPTF